MVWTELGRLTCLAISKKPSQLTISWLLWGLSLKKCFVFIRCAIRLVGLLFGKLMWIHLFLTEPWLWNRLSFCRYNCCKFTTFRKQIDLKRIDSYIINKVKEQKKRSSAFYLEKTSYLCTCIRPTPLPLILWEKWAVKREGGALHIRMRLLTHCFRLSGT